MGEKLVCIKRNRGQAIKPRSSATEIVTATTETASILSGQVVPAFMGEGVNGEAIDQRMPDSSRMVAMAQQARDLEEQLTKALGSHMAAAHEALLLPYEKAQIMQDYEGNRYLLSADLPWIGARTNDADGDHVAMLSDIVNPIGVKISASSDEQHIKELAGRLNPNNETGKLVFMLRLGGGNTERLDAVLDGIRDYAPNAVIMYDVHGVTKTINGRKIRAIPDIIDEIIELTHACNAHGLRMSGVHLETMADVSHRECIDRHGDIPTRPGYVDPRLNPGQLTHVLNAIAVTVLNQQLTESSKE
jgi:3-deoxy-7-phosphoheptulonate synthase